MNRLVRAGVASVVALTVTVALLNLTVYIEASVPSRGDLPDLPDGLMISDERAGCGSGGCYLEFDVEGSPSDTPESILDRLPSKEQCSANSLVDRRKLCVGYRMGSHGVRGYVSLSTWWR